jgi:GAF domain-containing protein
MPRSGSRQGISGVTDASWVGQWRRLTSSLATARGEADRLATAADHALHLVEACDHASVSSLRGGRFVTDHATDGQALRVDRLQYEANEGPCLDSLTKQEVVVVGDLAGDDRWPSLSQSVGETGVRSSLSVPMRHGRSALASVNLYSTRPEGFSATDKGIAEALADSVAIAASAAREIDQLTTALRTRTIIGQAEGILMERLGLDSEQAFAYLRRTSQDLNRKLAQVAADIVETRQLPTGPPFAD